MTIEHGNKAWGDFLRTVKASRGANVQVTGQPLADELVAQVIADDATHLTRPLRWCQFGTQYLVIGVAAQFSYLEIQAGGAGIWLQALCPTVGNVFCYQSAVPALGAGAAPTNFFGDTAPTSLIQQGAAAAPAPPVLPWGMNVPGASNQQTPLNPARGVYVPPGQYLVISSQLVNVAIAGFVLIGEVPLARTAP